MHYILIYDPRNTREINIEGARARAREWRMAKSGIKAKKKEEKLASRDNAIMICALSKDLCSLVRRSLVSPVRLREYNAGLYILISIIINYYIATSDLRAYRINGTSERDRHLVHLERDSKVTFGYRPPPPSEHFLSAQFRAHGRANPSKRTFLFSSCSFFRLPRPFTFPDPTVKYVETACTSKE